MNKAAVLELIRSQLEKENHAITLAAKAAHEAATHEESKAEDSHDTRGLESSYLAGAQAQRAQELSQQITYFKFLSLKPFSDRDQIAPSAIVELVCDGKSALYFVAAQGGGIKVQFGKDRIQVITPQSPLGEELMGRRKGDSFEIEAQGGAREYEVRSLC